MRNDESLPAAENAPLIAANSPARYSGPDVRNHDISRLAEGRTLNRPPRTIDIRGQMILLGTGTSVGVPAIGCDCPVCTGGDPKNQRTRCSVILGLPEGNLLIDTAPDLRSQLLREGIGLLHAVLFTHEHADHLFGLDDLRLFQFYLGHAVPLYCEPGVEKRIRTTFDYAFTPAAQTHVGSVPKLEFRGIDLTPFQVLGQTVIPIRLKHGPRFDVLGFRFGDIAYCTDTNEIPEESWPLLQGLEVLILDALRPRPHATHFGLDEAVSVVRKLRPRRAVFTHMSHELDYHETNRNLPAGMELGFDGMRIPLGGSWPERQTASAPGQSTGLS